MDLYSTTLNVDACSGNRLWAKHVSDRDLPEVCDSLRLFREPVSTQDLFLKSFLEPQGQYKELFFKIRNLN